MPPVPMKVILDAAGIYNCAKGAFNVNFLRLQTTGG